MYFKKITFSQDFQIISSVPVKKLRSLNVGYNGRGTYTYTWLATRRCCSCWKIFSIVRKSNDYFLLSTCKSWKITTMCTRVQLYYILVSWAGDKLDLIILRARGSTCTLFPTTVINSATRRVPEFRSQWKQLISRSGINRVEDALSSAVLLDEIVTSQIRPQLFTNVVVEV